MADTSRLDLLAHAASRSPPSPAASEASAGDMADLSLEPRARRLPASAPLPPHPALPPSPLSPLEPVRRSSHDLPALQSLGLPSTRHWAYPYTPQSQSQSQSQSHSQSHSLGQGRRHSAPQAYAPDKLVHARWIPSDAAHLLAPAYLEQQAALGAAFTRPPTPTSAPESGGFPQSSTPTPRGWATTPSSPTKRAFHRERAPVRARSKTPPPSSPRRRCLRLQVGGKIPRRR